MRTSRILAAAAGLLLSSAAAQAADLPSWPGRPGAYVFEVTRDGTPIGTQTVTVKQEGGTVTATTESKIAVEMLGIVVYRLHQVFIETYRDRRLVSVYTETRDPSGLRAGELRREGDHWHGEIGRQTRDFDCACETSSMWHRATLKGTSMIEASMGEKRSVTIADQGSATLDLPEGAVETRHFAVKGEIEREVWYDGAGNLVSARQIGSDGSLIEQNLLSDPQASRLAGEEAAEP